MKLHEIFRITRGDRVAVVGAGGKTSTLIRLGESLGSDTILTTTTHVCVTPFLGTAVHAEVHTVDEYRGIRQLAGKQPVILTGDMQDEIRHAGPPAEVLDALARDADSGGLTVIVEADGSRGLAVKAPRMDEPAIPAWCNRVIVCAGMSAIGQTLTAQHVHRPELYAELSGLAAGDLITPEAALKVLTHPLGGLKNIPPRAEKILLLNQADSELDQSRAGSMARAALRGGYDRVLIASLGWDRPEWQVVSRLEPVAGVLLAAGGSSRMGQPKQLLEVDGQPLIRRSAQIALQAGLNPLVVVVGAQGEQAAEALHGMNVKIVHNPDWALGQSTSVLAGLKALPLRTGSVAYLLADQPYVSAELIRALMERWYTGYGQIVAPLIAGARANPVLFDRSTFGGFAGLSGDQGAKALLQKFKVDYLPWQDEQVLLDLDTMDDYVRFKRG